MLVVAILEGERKPLLLHLRQHSLLIIAFGDGTNHDAALRAVAKALSPAHAQPGRKTKVSQCPFYQCLM